MKFRKELIILLVLAFVVSNISPVFAGYRFGLDSLNSRRVQDTALESEFPFHEEWTAQLGGQVESQPIIANNFIYVQAGKYLVKLSLDGKTVVKTKYVVNNHERPSGSSPTYANTKYGPRIYQATRDHRLWAIDPNTLQPLWDYGAYGQALVISAGGKPEKSYRITSSPLVITNPGQNPIISLGSGQGDLTSSSGQYADNGFFVLEDKGSRGSVKYYRRMDGEVTGSPILHNNMIIATENRWMADSQVLRYNLLSNSELRRTTKTDNGIPGSPAGENQYFYVADQVGNLYKYWNKNETEFPMQWRNPTGPSDIDYNRTGSSTNLSSPTIGDKYVFLPIRHYKNRATAGPGAVIAVDKSTGKTAWVKGFASALKANVLYWKPSDKGYLFVYEANGSAWVLDEATGQPVEWFKDKAGKLLKNAKLTGTLSGLNTSELVIDSNLLLIVDGAGMMHAFKSKKGTNFKLANLTTTVKKTFNPGETVTLQFEVTNDSEDDHQNIPLVLEFPDGSKAETTVNLKAGEKTTVRPFSFEMVPSTNKSCKVTINPLGHPQEIKKEAPAAKSDNFDTYDLASTSNDLEVKSLYAPSATSTNKIETIKTVLKNNSKKDFKKVLVRWKQDTKVIREVRVDLPFGKEVPLNFTWRSPAIEAMPNLSVTLDPNKETLDENYRNNFKELHVRVDQHSPMNCNLQKPSKSWEVTYWLITGYPTKTRHWTTYDADGKSHWHSSSYTDYTDPKWETRTVSYNEALSGSLAVDTRQGRPTDSANPKASDRESRGSWEIIPWARQQGLDPDQITRAGYGFELKVVTNYYNDWESKVPTGYESTAVPIGGDYDGPDKVWAEFFDTHGKYVGKVSLERTSGTGREGTATWELPEQSFRFSDGQVIYERKHYTSPDIRDGDYKVIVHVENAGFNDLYICKELNVKIHGSMYDDQYTSVQGKN